MFSRAGWPPGVGRHVLAEVDSTNAEAARIATGLTAPVWILGLHQTAARGRRGRSWAMPAGNFAATLVMQPSEPPGVVALRSFVAALALHDALVALNTVPSALGLKWPNDVLLNGGKVAGILLESAGQGACLAHLAIGIGVNLAAAPAADQVEPGARRPVSVFGETGTSIGPEAFLDLLAGAYAVREAEFCAGGFAPIRAAWLDRAAWRGQQMVARTGSRIYQGRFETVDEQGALILATVAGPIAIAAADVFFEGDGPFKGDGHVAGH